MENLAQSEHYFHLYRFVMVQSLHCVAADFCSSCEIAFLHLVLSYKVPELIVTDCHKQPSVDYQTSLALLYYPDHIVEFLQPFRI